MTFYQKVRVFFPLATKVTITRCSWMEKLGRFLDMIDVLVICSRQLTFSNVVECGRFFRHWNFSGISLYLYIDVLCILLLKIRCMYVLYVLCPCVSRYQLDKYTHTNTYRVNVSAKFAHGFLYILVTLAGNHQRQHIGSTFTFGIGWLHIQNTKWASIFRPFCMYIKSASMVRFNLPVFMWLILLYVQNVSFGMCACILYKDRYTVTCIYIYVYIYTVNVKNKDTPCFPEKTIPSEKCKEYVKHICNGLSSIFRNFFEFYVQGWMFWFRYFNTKYKKMYRIKLSCLVWITK